ncbi:FAD-dependent monooxygenase [Salmonella enterica]
MKKILIVGAGPVGLMIGCYLNKYNIDFDIIDKNIESTTYSKALTVSPTTIKAFHGLNLSEKLIKKGRKVDSVYVYYKNKKCLHINNKYIPSCYNYHISIPQPETERLLEDSLYNFGHRVKRGHKLISWSQENGAYKTSLLNEIQQEYTLSYDFIIGADGASSTVRELANIGFNGHDYDMHFIMADVFFDNKMSLPGTSYHIDESGFLIFLPMSGNMVRIVIKKDGKLPSPRPAPGIKEINHYLSRYYNKIGKATDLLWSSSANFYNRIADINYKENIFLAGDSFHLFSPIGGQGMNTGIQDAINLSWKLAFYIKGVATENLLSTYSSQRFTAVKRVLNSTDHDTGLIAGILPKKSIDAIYYPEYCNRNSYRHILPLKYAGFTATQESEPDSSMAGHHVPYFNFLSNNDGFKNTYDAFTTGKVIIFSTKKEPTPFLSALNNSFFMFCYIENADVDFIKLLNIKTNEYAVLNPDGYIGFTGNKTELSNYLSFLYGQKLL